MHRRRVAEPQRIEFPKRKPDESIVLPINLHREPTTQALDTRHRPKLRLHKAEPFVRVGEKNPVAFVDALLADTERSIAQLPRLLSGGLRLAIQRATSALVAAQIKFSRGFAIPARIQAATSSRSASSLVGSTWSCPLSL